MCEIIKVDFKVLNHQIFEILLNEYWTKIEWTNKQFGIKSFQFKDFEEWMHFFQARIVEKNTQ